MPTTRHRTLVLCCDGTWGGDEPRVGCTNVKAVADSFYSSGQLKDADSASVRRVDASKVFHNEQTNTYIRYFNGVGFDAENDAAYLLDGALAMSVKQRCVEAYAFLCDYTLELEPPQLYMFGFSRGAFTVRSVAAMINNFGLTMRPEKTDDETEKEFQTRRDDLYGAVYNNFRNRDEAFHPHSKFAKRWRKERSHPSTGPPIRFMGLFDTVGSLGVPDFVPGAVRPQYEFYDTNISTAVQSVCQALALTDRCSFFTPTFIRRNVRRADTAPAGETVSTEIPLTTSEVWFPGSHYDIGRQRLVSGRFKRFPLGKIAHDCIDDHNYLGLNVVYSKALADRPLLWMLKCAKACDPDGMLLCESAQDYVNKVPGDVPSRGEHDLLPWSVAGIHLTSGLPFFRLDEKSMDAYDAIAGGVPLLREVVLSDREVPLNEWRLPSSVSGAATTLARAVFYKADAAMSDEDAEETYRAHEGTAFKSRAFAVYKTNKFDKDKLRWCTDPDKLVRCETAGMT